MRIMTQQQTADTETFFDCIKRKRKAQHVCTQYVKRAWDKLNFFCAYPIWMDKANGVKSLSIKAVLILFSVGT